MLTLPESVADKDFPVLSDEQGEKMKAAIEAARMDLDSVGGIVECLATGFPAGLGRPISIILRAVWLRFFLAFLQLKV